MKRDPAKDLYLEWTGTNAAGVAEYSMYPVEGAIITKGIREKTIRINHVNGTARLQDAVELEKQT